MIRMIGGQQIEIPEDEEGVIDVEEVRSQLGLEPSRILIEQLPGGRNQVLPAKGKVQLARYSHLMNAPGLKRGGKR
jgi:hypothetical protein